MFNHKCLTKVLAVLLLIALIGDFLSTTLYLGRSFSEVLWFCFIAGILLVIGIFLRSSLVVNSVLLNSIIFQTPWNVDFILKILGFQGLGLTEWVYHVPFLISLPSILVHVLIIPLAIYATYVYGFNRRSLFVAISLFPFLALLLPFLFSSFSQDINCVFYPCDMSSSVAKSLISSEGYGSLLYFMKIVLWRMFEIVISYFVISVLIKKFFRKSIKIV